MTQIVNVQAAIQDIIQTQAEIVQLVLPLGQDALLVPLPNVKHAQADIL